MSYYSDYTHHTGSNSSGSGGAPASSQGPPPQPGPKKKKKLADKILPQKVRDLVPESEAYMDLLAFERKLDSTIMRKRLDIQVHLVTDCFILL